VPDVEDWRLAFQVGKDGVNVAPESEGKTLDALCCLGGVVLIDVCGDLIAPASALLGGAEVRSELVGRRPGVDLAVLAEDVDQFLPGSLCAAVVVGGRSIECAL
jgi:hypothetical protein